MAYLDTRAQLLINPYFQDTRGETREGRGKFSHERYNWRQIEGDDEMKKSDFEQTSELRSKI